MAVNTAALKTFAPAMRRQLMEAVGRKLDLLLNSQTPDTLSTYAKQIAELRDEQERSREQLLERVAYTWFNRLCALRYLDAKGWHPFGCKVLMPADGSETQPELLKLMRSGSLPADLKAFTNEQRLNQLLDGQIPTAIPGGDAQGEVYRELVLAACRSYHQLLPDLFEGLDDASELLLPDDLLTEGSITGSFRSSISDSDCEDVEIIGWLYQFYISEKKDEVMARKKAVPSEDIPAVTQLFTPQWIVRYLVENSLGRLWLLNRPDSKLRERMPYYIESEAEDDFLTINKPEDIKILDPACGSGHILTYAFDLLTFIYEEEGYGSNEIPTLIIQNNLHGMEICPRATQLGQLALTFKAREKNRRFFKSEQIAHPKIIELQDVKLEPNELNSFLEVANRNDLLNFSLVSQLNQLEKAKTIGSLARIECDSITASEAYEAIREANPGDNITTRDTHRRALAFLQQAKMLSQKYHIVVANPPYIGSGNMCSELKEYAKKNYPSSKNDAFGMFIEKSISLCLNKGIASLVTLPSWLFLTNFENLRRNILKETTFLTMLHMGRGIFGIDWGSVAFVMLKSAIPLRDSPYFRLHKRNFQHIDVDDIEQLFLLSKNNQEYRYNFDDYRSAGAKQPIPSETNIGGQKLFYRAKAKDFESIPGCPIAYWLPADVRQLFINSTSFKAIGNPKVGMQTSNNSKYLRLWHEIGLPYDLNLETNKRLDEGLLPLWVKYLKGGGFRKWYGNLEYLLHTKGSPQYILSQKNATLLPNENLFKIKCTWNDIASAPFGARIAPKDSFNDISGHCFYPSETDQYWLLALSNSNVFSYFLSFLNPSFHFQVGDIGRIPVNASEEAKGTSDKLARSLIEIYKLDWDSRETSWGFAESPFFSDGNRSFSLSKTWHKLEHSCNQMIEKAKALEEANNQLWIDEYRLNDLVDSDLHDQDISIKTKDKNSSIAEFISYATGCMMGRYSLDHPGLILADSRSNQDEQLAAYEAKIGKSISEIQFKPDADAIIPVLDGDWFEDDIVARTREFLKVTFPESSVAENLCFIEDSIGKDIRKYFCKDFYKDHLQTYKKRPIYWMVQSPKAGFACLIYLHRYTPDTLLQVLNNYFRPYLQKLEARQEQLERDQNNDSLPKREQTAARKEAEKITKVLKECQAWEQDALLPLAQQRIELDLDDGVKVNYLKLQEVLAKIPGLAAKGD